jgi:hypothetical protein
MPTAAHYPFAIRSETAGVFSEQLRWVSKFLSFTAITNSVDLMKNV